MIQIILIVWFKLRYLSAVSVTLKGIFFCMSNKAAWPINAGGYTSFSDCIVLIRHKLNKHK